MCRYGNSASEKKKSREAGQSHQKGGPGLRTIYPPGYFIIKEKAAKAGTTASAYLRQVAIYATVTTRLTEKERQFVRQLIGMANNLNQLAKSCHEEGALRAMLYFENYRGHLDDSKPVPAHPFTIPAGISAKNQKQKS